MGPQNTPILRRAKCFLHIFKTQFDTLGSGCFYAFAMSNTTKQTSAQKAESAYVDAYHRAMQALKDIEIKIHEMPAAEGKTIHWRDVGDMLKIAAELEDFAQ